MTFLLPPPTYVRLVAMLSITTLFVTGCWDRRKLNELAIVISMAIDKGQEDGSYLISYKIANPQANGTAGGGGGGSGGGDQSQNFFIVSGEGSSIVDANQEIQYHLSRRLFFSQVQVILFGEELARQGVGPILDYLERNGQLRRTMWIGVVEGEGREVLKTSAAPIEVSADVASTLDLGPKHGIVTVLFGDFLERLGSPGSAAIATAARVTEKGASLSGTAVFNSDRLVGFLDSDASLGLGIALGKIEAGTVLVGRDSEPSEGKTTVFRIQQVNGRLKPDIRDGNFHMTIDVDVKSVLEEQTSVDEDFTTTEGWQAIEILQATVVRNLIRSALDHSQTWQADAFRFGDVFSRYFPKQWAEVENRWNEVFPTVTVTINVNSTVSQGGLITKRVPIR